MFVTNLFHSLMSRGKNEFLKYSFLRGDIWKVFGCLRKFVEICYEYVMFARLKEIYRTNTIAQSVFFVGNTQVPIIDPTYHETSP